MQIVRATSFGLLLACGLLASNTAAAGWDPVPPDPEATAISTESVPPGAAALGYSQCIIDEHPTAADIAPGRTGDYKWFSGEWYQKPVPPMQDYQTEKGVLAVSLNGNLVSAPQDFSASKLPALSGADGFYAEFSVQLSDNDPDHWPAVWLMPIEHNAAKDDHYAGDPANFERWAELDVDEGGWGPGLTGTVHAWQGIWPHYSNIANKNNHSPNALDRTKEHTFGLSYDPHGQRVTWWLDGESQMWAGSPFVPEIATRQHFYLLISAQSHKENKPYVMFVSRVRACIAPTVAPPSPHLRVE